MPDCLEGVRLVPVYQRAQLRVVSAEVWEWAVSELRSHVLKSEQNVLMSFPGVRPKMKEFQLQDKRNASREQNLIISHHTSR